jgi:O-antigen/teichoic acid export membrane protein
MSDIQHEVQRHGIMYFVSSIGITLIGFLATIFYAHWVGAETLGSYFVFLSLFTLLCVIIDFGISYGGTQRICEGKDPDAFFTASLAIRSGIYLLVVIALILFQDNFVDIKKAGLFWLLIFALYISMLQTSIGISISASNRLGLAATATLINNLFRIVVQVITIFLGFQVYGLVGGLIAGILIELLIELKFMDYHLKKFSLSHIKSLFSFSSWAFIINTGTTLFDNANILIIAYFLPVSDVGIFGVCWTFSVFALFVSTSLCNTLYVKVSRWNTAGKLDIISASLSRATTYSLVFAVPMLAGGLILGEQLLFFIYGASFASGATALVIIIAARVIQSIYQLYSNYLMAINHVQTAFYGLGVGITVNIILSLILVPILGLPGAAIASLMNVIISIIIGQHFLKRITPIIIEKQSIIHIIISTIIMTITLLLLKFIPLQTSVTVILIMVILGSAIYFFTLLTLNKQLKEDAFTTLNIQWISK